MDTTGCLQFNFHNVGTDYKQMSKITKEPNILVVCLPACLTLWLSMNQSFFNNEIAAKIGSNGLRCGSVGRAVASDTSSIPVIELIYNELIYI